MRLAEIESWTLRVADQVLRGSPNEDGRVELKTELPTEAAKAARQIAAMANSAYGETVLWVVGIDEKNRKAPGAKATELSDWWAKVESCFDEVSPSIQSLTVRFQEVDLLSLAFGTDRVPFVVKNPDGGRITREVPWRGANRTDSAKRSELVRLLNPSVKMPSFEILDVTFLSILQNNVAYRATVSITIYVLPRTADRIVFPIHKLYLAFEQAGKMPFRFGDVQMKVPHGQNFDYNPPKPIVSSTIIESSFEVIVDGPGRIELKAGGDVPYGPFIHEPLKVTAGLSPAASETQAVLVAILGYAYGDAQYGTWKLVRAR